MYSALTRHPDYLRHTDLHPHALDLLSAIPQDHTHLSSFYAEQAIATYYAKYPTTLARELAQNPATALTENELERLKWEGGRGELFILSSTTPHPRIQEVIQTITDRLERSPKNEDPPILL